MWFLLRFLTGTRPAQANVAGGGDLVATTVSYTVKDTSGAAIATGSGPAGTSFLAPSISISISISIFRVVFSFV